jgi:hypothetical protein
MRHPAQTEQATRHATEFGWNEATRLPSAGRESDGWSVPFRAAAKERPTQLKIEAADHELEPCT